MGVYAELRGFVLAHRECGVLRGASKPLEGGGVRTARLQEALASFQS